MSAETNIVCESAFDRQIENQSQETGLANGSEKMSELNEFEIPLEKSDLSVETNIIGESAFDREIEDLPQETWLAEETSELKEEDLERKFQFEIPFEKNDSSSDTNIERYWFPQTNHFSQRTG